MTTPQAAIQADWANREFIETVSTAVKRIVEFLNNFEMSARYRLAVLNERLTSVERSLEFIEAKVNKPEEGS
eukprot:m.32324 g.32324  ORF g.32324 m.32324 type:complete len:72 (+) comp10871_c0_seq1:121-336(+)